VKPQVEANPFKSTNIQLSWSSIPSTTLRYNVNNNEPFWHALDEHTVAYKKIKAQFLNEN
jgi:hypothetical protein